VAVVALLFAHLSPHTPPNNLWFMTLFGMAYPLILIINIAFIIYWLFRAKIWLFISLVPIIYGYSHIYKYFQFNPKNEIKTEKRIKYLDMNVKSFMEKKSQDKLYAFFDYLKEAQPDILVFQEYDVIKKINNKPVTKYILETIKTPMYYSLKKNNRQREQAIFSKYPIIKTGEVIFSNNRYVNGVIWADIVCFKDTLRIINVHLQSYGISQNIQMDKLDEKEYAIEESKNVITRIKNGTQKRVVQMQELLALIKETPYKIILSGDFNDPPMSYSYHQMSNVLKDAFMESGNGLGGTFVGPFPSYRIDYIFHSPEIISNNFERGKNYQSDHRLIECELAWE